MRVSQWMTPEPQTVPPATTLAAALEEMRRRRVRRLPVADSEGKLVGIITRNDIYAQLGPEADEPRRPEAGLRTVAQYMAHHPATISPEATLAEAAAEMYRRRISGLPVVRDGRLVGIITETDMFRAFVIMLGFTEQGGTVEFELEKPDNLLGQIRTRAAGMIIRNLVVYHEPRHGRIGVQMKIRGREEHPERRPDAEGADRG